MSSQDIASRILRYPLDLSGTSPDNYVEGEICHLTNLKNRGFVLSNGPFYTESLEVFDNVTGEKLTKKVQYTAAQLVEAATVRSGKEVCAVIIITDQAVSNEVRVNYQAVGGPYILNVDALTEMMSTIEIDERPVVWGAIIGKPNLFPPGHHLHDAGDVYGFEYMVLALEEIRKAILMGDVASHDEIRAYIDSIDVRLTERMDNLLDGLEAHMADSTNPHRVTKAQVGLGSVGNYGVATNVEAIAGTSNLKYMTPLRVMEVVTQFAITPLNTHINNTSNPHATTKAQVGLDSVENYGIATKAEAEAGTNNVKYMTPLRTAEAITVQALTPLNAHIARVDNPHNVTKEQIGLGNVLNYIIATKVEAEAGVVNNAYMTPLRVKEALTVLAVNPLTALMNSHIERIDNPHNVTAAQIGLGNVLNYGIATKLEAEAGAVNNKFTTPQSMMQFRNAYQTVSTVDPTTTIGFKNGHIWYKV